MMFSTCLHETTSVIRVFRSNRPVLKGLHLLKVFQQLLRSCRVKIGIHFLKNLFLHSKKSLFACKDTNYFPNRQILGRESRAYTQGADSTNGAAP